MIYCCFCCSTSQSTGDIIELIINHKRLINNRDEMGSRGSIIRYCVKRGLKNVVKEDGVLKEGKKTMGDVVLD